MKKISIALFLFSLATFCFADQAFAYDNKITHPALTQEIVAFYNSSSGDKLTDEQKEWVIQGSIDEDEAPRWINHFYDPIHNTGWTGEKAGKLYSGLVLTFSFLAFSQEGPDSAIDWIKNPLIQTEYKLYGGDQSWPTALQNYADGNEEAAYKTLGHLLHVLEDMGVPDHTRNDTHAHIPRVDTGSPYEDWAQKYNRNTIKELHIPQSLEQAGIVPPAKQKPEDYLTSLAGYSNKYFFSKDTINDSRYAEPKIIKEEDGLGYGKDESGKVFPLAKLGLEKQESGDYLEQPSLKLNPVYYPILDAYFSHLSRKIVLNGAGFIGLFKKKQQDALIAKEYPQHIVRYDFSFLTPPVISVYATVDKAVEAVSSFFSNVGSSVAGLFGGSRNSTTSSPESSANLASAPVASGNLPVVQNSSAKPEPAAVPVKTAPAAVPKGTATVFSGGEKTMPPVPAAASGVEKMVPPVAVAMPSAGSGSEFQKESSPPAEHENPGPLVFGGGAPVINNSSDQGAAPNVGNAENNNSNNNQGATNVSNGSGSASSSASLGEASTMSNATSSGANQNSSSSPLWSLAAPVGEITYSTSSMTLTLAWQSVAGENATSTVSYRVWDLDSATSTATTSTRFIKPINAIGRDYQFALQAIDDQNRESASSTVAFHIPSFFSRLAFYEDPRTADQYLIEGWYAHYPFIPDYPNAGVGSSWRLAIFYLNTEPAPLGVLDDAFWTPSDTANIVPLRYITCSYGGLSTRYTIILPDAADRCGTPGGAYNLALTWNNLEDPHLLLQTDDLGGQRGFQATAPGENFITAVFYAPYNIMPSDSRVPHFGLVAIDKTKYYLGISPAHQAPVLSGAVSTTFDEANSRVTFKWQPATDADTLDSNLAYEYQRTADGAWNSLGGADQAVLPVSLGDTINFAVRARDDFGVTSTPLTASWSYPHATIFLSQTVADTDSPTFGTRDGLWNPTMLAQSIQFANDEDLSKAALRIRQTGGDSGNLRLRVMADDGNNRPDLSAELSSAVIENVSSPNPDQELLFSFSPAVHLAAGTKHWLLLDISRYVYGNGYDQWFTNSWKAKMSAADSYPDGEAIYYSNGNPSSLTGDWYMKLAE